MGFNLSLGKLWVHLGLDSKAFTAKMAAAEAQMVVSGRKMTAMGQTMTTKLTVPLLGFGASSAVTWGKFDDAMTKSTAIMRGMSEGMRAELEKTALTLSERSVKSADELARSYFYLASAGMNAEQSLAALGAVEAFAVAGAFDMAKATDLLTDAQSALKLKVEDTTENMRNMVRVSDLLIGANTLANASTEQFAESLTTEAGAAIAQFNLDLEESIAVLAVYADQGIKGAKAGSMYGRMLRLLMKSVNENREAWKALGVEYTKDGERLTSLTDIVAGLSDELQYMGNLTVQATLTQLGFQARAQQSILPLLGSADAIRQYNENLEKMAGITAKIREIQMESFAARMKTVWNRMVNMGKDIGRVLEPKIIALGRSVTRLTEGWKKLNEPTKELIVNLGIAAAAAGPLLIITGKLVTSVGLLSLGMRTLGPHLAKVVGLFKSVLVVTTPALLAIGGLVAVAYTLRAAWKQNVEWIRKHLEGMAEYFRKAWDYIANSVIGKFIKWFADSWWKMFDVAKKRLAKFGQDVAGMWAGLTAAIKGEDFWTAFTEGYGEAEVRFREMNEALVATFEAAPAVIKTYAAATRDTFAELGDAVKKQLTADIAAATNAIKQQILEVQAVQVETGVDMSETEESLQRQLHLLEKKNEEIAESNRVNKLFAEQIRKAKGELELELELIGKTNEERERSLKLMEFHNLLIQKWNEGSAEYQKHWAEYNDLLDQIGEKNRQAFSNEALKYWAEDASNLMGNFKQVAVDAFNGMADALTDFLAKGKADFKAFTTAVLSDMLRIIMRAQMMQIFQGFAGMGGPIGELFSWAAPSAKGNVVAGGQLVPLEQGAVLQGPTLIPLENRKTALAAEERPEAIMPLQRDRSGRLGVAAQGATQQPEVKLKVVNAWSRDEMFAAMQSEEGEQVFTNLMHKHGVI